MTPLFRTDDTSLSHHELAALTTVLAETQTWQTVATDAAAAGTGAAYEDNVFGDAFGQPFGAQQTIGNVTYF